LARKHLNENGLEVMMARDGLAGLERAKQTQPDLILLDILMPEMDGFETCMLLKENSLTDHIPIIFMTAVDNVADKVKGFEVGGVDYVTKPVEVNELLARVKAHLQINQLQRDLQYYNEQLEQRVADRTAELQAEINQRIQYQQEKDKLLDVVLQQSQQLQELTQLIVTSQQAKYVALSQSIEQQLNHDLKLLEVLMNNQKLEVYDNPHEARNLLKRIQTYVYQAQTSLNEAIETQQALLDDPSLQLTAREKEVLHLLVDGKSNSMVAELLSISVSSVQTYRQRIMKKLNITKFTDLVKLVVTQPTLGS
jgi:DNA-binding response OmpR family regulator/DNA-binding CsgD family transcriptional regulator